MRKLRNITKRKQRKTKSRKTKSTRTKKGGNGNNYINKNIRYVRNGKQSEPEPEPKNKSMYQKIFGTKEEINQRKLEKEKKRQEYLDEIYNDPKNF
jgi:hypothetical protein